MSSSSRASGESPVKKLRETKDGPQKSDPNGSYPYPQHYAYQSNGGPQQPYVYSRQQQPAPYPSGNDYGSGPPHIQNSMYCQPTSAAYSGHANQPYGRSSASLYGPSGSYSSGARKTPSRPSPSTSRATSISESVIRKSTGLQKEKDDLGKDKGRGSYRCGKCGVPKKGHICPYQPKLKRRPDEPPPETRNAATQVEMDEFLVVRRLNLEIQGFAESYTAAPMGDVGAEVHPPTPMSHSQQKHQSIGSPNLRVAAASTVQQMNAGSLGLSKHSPLQAVSSASVGKSCATTSIGADPTQKEEMSSSLMPSEK